MRAKKLKPVEISDICRYTFPGNLMYSPAGTYLAFQAARADKDGTGYHRDIWVIKDGVPVQMTASLNSTAVLWADEETLLIRRSTEDSQAGTTELYRLSMAGGEAEHWITLPFVLKTLKKLTDDVYAAVGVIDANDPDAYLDDEPAREKKLEEKKKDRDYTVVDEIPYWHNGADFTNKQRSALFRIDTAGGLKVKRLTGPYTNVMSVETDGMAVYYTSETHERKQSRMCDVHVYHADTGRTTVIYNKKDFSIQNLFIMDGHLYCLASDMKEYGLGQLPHIAQIRNRKIWLITKPDRSFGNHVTVDVILDGGKSSAVCGKQWISLITDDDHTAIWSFDGNMQHKVLFDEQGSIPFLDVCNDRIAFCRVTSDHPAEIWEMNISGEAPHVLTHFNDDAVQDRYIALPHRLDFESCGEKLHGWVLLPQGYEPKKRYPGILNVHGGPRGAYGEGFFHEMQVWASRGYIVFFTNIIGSDGRGDAFADVRGKYGTVDFQNLMDFTDEVLKAYPVDPAKVCAAGGSYGGFMMNWFAGHTDRFCALASQRSIASWISLTFMADIGPWFDPSECGVGINDNLLSEESFAKLWQFSPLKYAEGAKTPMLFIHSDQDRRCPLPEGMQMMQALTVQDVETRLVIFHGENHELSRGGKPVHRMRRLQEITDWFDKHTA